MHRRRSLAKAFLATALTISRSGDLPMSSIGSRQLLEDRRQRSFSSQGMGPQVLGISPGFAGASALPLSRQLRTKRATGHILSTHISPRRSVYVLPTVGSKHQIRPGCRE